MYQRNPEPGDYVVHYKKREIADGFIYLVLAVEPSRTDGKMTVVYVALYTDADGVFGKIHTRHLDEWIEPVDKPEYTGTRFIRLSPGRNIMKAAIKALVDKV